MTFSERGSLWLGAPGALHFAFPAAAFTGRKLKYFIFSVLKACKRYYSSKVIVLTR